MRLGSTLTGAEANGDARSRLRFACSFGRITARPSILPLVPCWPGGRTQFAGLDGGLNLGPGCIQLGKRHEDEPLSNPRRLVSHALGRPGVHPVDDRDPGWLRSHALRILPPSRAMT